MLSKLELEGQREFICYPSRVLADARYHGFSTLGEKQSRFRSGSSGLAYRRLSHESMSLPPALTNTTDSGQRGM